MRRYRLSRSDAPLRGDDDDRRDRPPRRSSYPRDRGQGRVARDGRRSARTASGSRPPESRRSGRSAASPARLLVDQSGGKSVEAPRLRSGRRASDTAGATVTPSPPFSGATHRPTSTSSVTWTTSTGRSRAGSAWEANGGARTAALLYTQPSVPVFIAIADGAERDDGRTRRERSRPASPRSLRPRDLPAPRRSRPPLRGRASRASRQARTRSPRPARRRGDRRRCAEARRISTTSKRSTRRRTRRPGSSRGFWRRAGMSGFAATAGSFVSPASTSIRRGGASLRSATWRRCRSCADKGSPAVRARHCAGSSWPTASRQSVSTCTATTPRPSAPTHGSGSSPSPSTSRRCSAHAPSVRPGRREPPADRLG